MDADVQLSGDAVPPERPERLGPHLNGEPISPELALVSKELAAAARALLPDRPWERFAPRPTPSVLAAPATVPSGGRIVASLPRSTVRPLPAPPPEAPRRTRRRAVKLVLATAAFVGVVHLGAWESGGERLLTVATPAPTQAQPAQDGLAAGPSRPYPSARYVIRGGIGFDTDPGGGVMENFLLPVRCGAASLVVSHIAVREDGAFAFAGTIAGPVRVIVSGSFDGREIARGRVRATGRGCPVRPVRFVARVS